MKKHISQPAHYAEY